MRLAVLAPVVLALQPTQAAAQAQLAPVQRTPTYERHKKINAWLVGFTTGLIEGAPSHLERARVVGDGTNLLVLPIVRLGTTERLYVRDTIINSGACACLPMDGGFETHSPSKVQALGAIIL